ncbi:MAG TPA: hypothetical protein VG435_13865 [Acidimicrobiales bacterium]|jgi:uncharacterized membrane protein|nr:hypothetical protein [Acidimicrobiales bacterium]
MGTGFHILVLLHLLCVIGGFGALAYNGLYLNLAQRRRAGGTGAVLEINRMISGLAEILVYAAAVFGLAAVAASNKHFKFSDAWVSAALAVYIVDIAILHAWIRPNQRQYTDVVTRLEQPLADGETLESRTGDVNALQSFEKKVSAGWGVFNVLVIVAVYLMVFKPK